jgi:putative ABC transport system substrate-binding protein
LLITGSAATQQPTKNPRIGFLSATLLSTISPRIEAFRQGLRELGYFEGKNIVIEWRSAEGKLDRVPALAAEVVGLKVDVIVTGGATDTRAAKEATSTIATLWRRISILLPTGSSPALGDLAVTLLDCPHLPRS